jgi:hypothetical protein
MRSFGGPRDPSGIDLSKPGLREAGDAGDRSSVVHDEDLDLMTA